MTSKTENIFFQPLIVIATLWVSLSTFGQGSRLDAIEDSLSLEQIMTVVINNLPNIKKAEESIAQASARAGLAKTGYYPYINASASASTVGPVSEIELGSLGTYQLFPQNNFNVGINIQQNIYDFGKTATQINLSDQNKELSKNAIRVEKNRMAINVVQSYYALVFLQQAIRIKDEQLATLKEHLAFV